MSKLSVHKPGSILSFGELLLRICPDGDGNWLRENSLPFHVGGAELNVATALALWDLPTKYFTALPDNHLSAQLINYLQQKDIDTSPILFTGDRIGLFYLTPGRDMKHNALIYDRAHSAFAGLKPGMVDWDKALDGVSWFHFSAICPAISQNVADVCKEVLEAASKKNITISVDLNYRSKLWQYGKTPLEIMPDLVQHCNLVMGNIWAAETMLGIPVNADSLVSGDKNQYVKASQKASEAIMAQFPACKAIANTFRFDADDIQYYTTLFDGNKLYITAEYESPTIIDKVGSGDCFMAGLIYGFYKDMPLQDIVEFATAAAFAKLFIQGDATNISTEEIKKNDKTMSGRKKILDAIITQGVLPLFFYKDAAVSLEVIRVLYKAGIRVVEYTNRGEESLDNFIDIKKITHKVMPDLYLGIGTIKNLEEAEAFISAGADFMVSPIFSPDVAKITAEQKMLWIPGCMTPTEIHVAKQHGAPLIKLFPGNILGPAYVEAIRDLFPGQLFMPTGGVDMSHENITAWFRSGVCAVGMGSKLISKHLLENKLYDQLYSDTIKILEIVQSIK